MHPVLCPAMLSHAACKLPVLLHASLLCLTFLLCYVQNSDPATCRTVIGGDASCQLIAAASIIAKVCWAGRRDALCSGLNSRSVISLQPKMIAHLDKPPCCMNENQIPLSGKEATFWLPRPVMRPELREHCKHNNCLEVVGSWTVAGDTRQAHAGARWHVPSIWICTAQRIWHGKALAGTEAVRTMSHPPHELCTHAHNSSKHWLRGWA